MRISKIIFFAIISSLMLSTSLHAQLDGSIINDFKVGDDVFVSPVIANETVYVLTDSAKLIALR